MYTPFYSLYTTTEPRSRLPLQVMKFTLFLWCFFLWSCRPTEATASSFVRFLHHTQRRASVGRPPLDEWSARPRDLYLTTHTTYKRQTSMFLAAFETTISAGERPQTHAFDRAATGTGNFCGYWSKIFRYGDRICQFAENERNLLPDYFACECVTIIRGYYKRKRHFQRYIVSKPLA